MTLTIDEQKVELPAPVQAALEADAKAQSRPVADVLAEKLTTLYAGVDLVEAASIRKGFDDVNVGRAVAREEFVEDGETARQERLRAALLANIEKAKATVPDPPSAPTRCAAKESVFGEIVTEKFRKQGFNL